MLFGTYSVKRVVENSCCRISKNYQLKGIGMYKIHSTSLMPEIPFAEAAESQKTIDQSIFVNDTETKPTLKTSIKCQNYLSTKYIGRVPFKSYDYDKGEYTEMGEKFQLRCKDGNPNTDYRVFGTQDVINGYNDNSTS